MFNDLYWHMSLDKFSAYSKKIVSVQFKIIVADQIIEMLLIFSHWKKNLYLFSTYIENCHQRNCRHSSSHARFVPLSINKTPQFTWIFSSSSSFFMPKGRKYVCCTYKATNLNNVSFCYLKEKAQGMVTHYKQN